MYEHFNLTKGGIVFPAYTSKEARQILREKLIKENNQLYCSCSREDKLYYKISSDLRFIPCHQNYVHKESCVRAGDKRRSAFVHEEDTGMSVAYLRFNPANFTITSVKRVDGEESGEIDENGIELENSLEKAEKDKKEKPKDREPFSPLATFIRSINFDSYMDRLISTGKVYSYEYFLSSLYKRLQYIRISPMKKSIKELDYKKDGFKFFYAELAGYILEDTPQISLKYFTNINKYFVYSSVLSKALKDFVKQYGVEPSFETDKLMAAGFMYERVSRKGNLYLTPGRLHIFKVNDLGVYSDEQKSLLITNILHDYIQKHKLYNKCKLYFDFDDYDKICDLRMDGRSDYLSFTYAKRNVLSMDEKNYPCYTIDEDGLIQLVQEWVDGRY